MWNGERLQELLDFKGWTQTDLARMLNVDKVTVWRWTKNRRTPNDEDKRKIADVLGCTVSYLIDESPTLPAPTRGGNHTSPDIAEGTPLSADVDSNAYYDPDEVQVPLYRMTSICAGYGVDNGTSTPEVVKKIPVKRSAIGHSPDSAYIALEVCGHSMEPRIPDGSTIVIDTSRKDPSHGDICYVRFRRNGGFEKDVIRFCYKDRSGGLELRAAEGNGIPSDYFSRDDLNEGYVQIVGVAVAKLTLERL